MTTPSSELCDVMASMARSPVLLSALMVCDVCCIAAVPLLSYWLVRVWKMKLMHYNTRLLVCFHIAWLLVHVIGRSVLHTMDLIVFLMPFKSGCDVLHTKIQCFFLRLSYNIGLISSNCSAIFVSLERLIATLYFRNYEGSFRNVGYFLLLMQVLLSSSLLSVIYAPTKLDNSPLLYCQTTSTSNFMWTIYPFSFLLGMQLLSVIIFEVASKKNRVSTFILVHFDRN
ncbi:hypothetical protein RB195_016325 [Necator americanus]|uniref:G-protein coupled receptors family 1 profile domain-containing protein n=1 Tax=Necator americanus TaxID=51031 RepID=A0ABR1EAH5_NECAM